MTGPEVLDVARDAIYTLIIVSAPVMLVGLAVGVAISLLQALTQIQEMTIAFVPKILAIFISLLIALPFMAEKLHAEMLRIAARIVSVIPKSGHRFMHIDISFLPALAAAFLLTFARVGTMVMLLPGIGEMNVPSRVRLTMALVLTAILLPAHQKAYAVDLKALGPVLVVLFQELLVGAVLGLTARLAISALQVAGSVVAQQLGLGFVTAVDPTQNQQGLLVGNFLTVLGITLIFRHRPASSGDRGAERQLHDLPARARCRSSATWRSTSPASSPPRSASASSCRRRFWCSACCSISASACCRG